MMLWYGLASALPLMTISDIGLGACRQTCMRCPRPILDGDLSGAVLKKTLLIVQACPYGEASWGCGSQPTCHLPTLWPSDSPLGGSEPALLHSEWAASAVCRLHRTLLRHGCVTRRKIYTYRRNERHNHPHVAALLPGSAPQIIGILCYRQICIHVAGAAQ